MQVHCKKRLAIFPSSAGMSLTKLSLARKNLIIPDQGEFLVTDIPAGDGKIAKPFLHRSGMPLVSSDEEAAGGVQVHAQCPMPLLTHASTNSVPVSPLKTDAPLFRALKAQTGFLRFKA
jgi:hypothetical protein